MAVTIYHNPKCSKSRETLALIQGKGIEPQVIEYLKTPPSAAELKDILGKLGIRAKDLLRKKEAAEAGVDPTQPEESLIAAMAAHPQVIERPIVVSGAKARLGRPPEQVLEIL
ncbi:MAG TPA: arsenate reductase (glutaredoxin) [Candidatus Sulfotelmatobacter sp.]|nr:arsenate reductase (glutaredoxin) [Candidatus Sulfotelmatobacter sp.]